MKNQIFTLFFALLSFTSMAQLNADFSFSPTEACAGTSIQFTDQSTGEIITYVWDLGDGNTSTDNNPSHVYSIGGTYTVCLTVTDSNGNQDTTCEPINILSQGLTFLTVELCPGETFFYNGQTFQAPGTFPNLFPNGAANGCDSIVQLEILYFPTSNTALQLLLCGEESVEVNGTMYSINNPIGTEIISAGSVNGCDSIIDVFVEEGLNINGQVTTVACGNDPVTIEVEVTNGLPPYSYEWYDPMGNLIATSEVLTVNESGLYLLQVSDAEGCSGTRNFTVIAETPVVINFLDFPPSCFGTADGAIDLIVDGSPSPLSFAWNNGANTEDISGLSAGLYSVTITDVLGCTLLQEFVLTEPEPILIELITSNIACNNDGFINLLVTGGVPPYTYLWSTGASTQNISNLIAGTYEVTVIDANGCLATATVVLPSPLDLQVESTFADCDSTNGTATATLNGITDATFLWSNNGTGATQTGLAPGWYSVTVSDPASNCLTHENVEVLEDTLCYVIISGQVLINPENPNCEIDANTIGAPFVMVALSDGQVTFTDGNGYYEFTADAGTYDISLNYNTGLYDPLCTDAISVEANELGLSYIDNHFFLTFGEGRDLEVKVVKQNARPGFSQYVGISLMNVGAVPVSGTLTFTHPDIQQYQFSAPPPDNYDAASQTLTWEFQDIQPNETYIYYNHLLTPIGTDLGTQLDYAILAEPVEGDVTPENNEKLCSIEVTGSYDPNDKQVEPAGIGPEGIISMADSLLSYKIRFQNTGTDTAFTVLIRDTLDPNLDLATIVPGPSSHTYTAKLNEGNILELLFENILLPDSFVNEPASNGFVIFDIQVKPGLGYGTRIENRAGIYFDFNPPIITNTVVNSLQMISSLPEPISLDLPLQIFPNPFTEESRLEYVLPDAEPVRIALYNLEGHLVRVLVDWEERAAGPQQEMLQNLQIPAGVYSIQVLSEQGKRGIKKFVKY